MVNKLYNEIGLKSNNIFTKISKKIVKNGGY